MSNSKSSEISEELRLRRAWMLTIVGVLIIGFLFLKPYLSIIALALLVSYLTQPIYKWFLQKTNNKKGAAASFTTVITLLIIGVPIMGILAIAILQGLSLVDSINIDSLTLGDGSLEQGIGNTVVEANLFIENISGIANAISADGVVSFIKDTVPAVLNTLFTAVFSLVAGIPSFFMNLIIFIFVYVGLLTNAENLQKVVRSLSPFGKEVNDKYFKRVGLMASSMFKGQMLIALLQGFGSALSLAIIGWGQFFWFFFIVFTFMSLIPLGSGIVTIPLGIVLLLFGNVWQGLFVLGVHFIYVTNIDNIRPKLVAKEARMPAALTILAAFAGVAYFGLLGVIYGPIIMIFVLTSIELYIEYKKKTQPAVGSH